MATVVAIVGDLLLGSRVQASLSAAGHEVTMAPGIDALALESAELVVADLAEVEPEALGGLSVPTLGFYSHVETETKRRADEAGVDLAVPRSRMSRELPVLVEQLLAGR